MTVNSHQINVFWKEHMKLVHDKIAGSTKSGPLHYSSFWKKMHAVNQVFGGGVSTFLNTYPLEHQTHQVFLQKIIYAFTERFGVNIPSFTF